jgi:hypothetical protein
MNTANAMKATEGASDGERSWPHVAALIDSGGHVTLGRVAPIDDVAVAANERKVFATLLRRKGESAADLMQCLDDALNHAAHGGAVINEVDGGQFVLARLSARKRR